MKSRRATHPPNSSSINALTASASARLGAPAFQASTTASAKASGASDAQSFNSDVDSRSKLVMPVTTGVFGREKRGPYWELQARVKPILGIYHCGMIVERPAGCGPIRLAAFGEGDLQTRLFTIPVRPKERAWGRVG